MVHDGFADMGKLNLKSESYDFKCAFIYQEENFLIGHNAKILLQPRLYINNVPSNLNVLNNTVVSAILTNHENIP